MSLHTPERTREAARPADVHPPVRPSTSVAPRPPVPTQAPTRYIWLDLVRGLCALAVCAGHLRAALFVDNAKLGASNGLQKAFYFSTGLGHQAVMVFFVLSGFFVGGSLWRNRHRFRPLRYASARLTRLWVVLIPALLWTAAIDALIAHWAPEVLSGQYRVLWNSGPGGDAPYSGGVQTFLANVLFLQSVAAPVFGTNGPLWSLANEFFYYLLFPLLLMAAGATRIRGERVPLWARLAGGAAVVALALWLPPALLGGFVIWGLGLVVYAMLGKTQGRLNTALVAVGLLLFLAALHYSKSAGLQQVLGVPADLVVGAGFCLWVIGLANRGAEPALPRAMRRVATSLSDVSYSLYLVHFPLVALIGGVVFKEQKLNPDALGLAVFMGWLAVLVIAGYAFYAVFERRTEAVRRWVDRRWT